MAASGQVQGCLKCQKTPFVISLLLQDIDRFGLEIRQG